MTAYDYMRRHLLESVGFSITIDDLKRLLDKVMLDREAERMIDLIVDFYYRGDDDKEYVEKLLANASRAATIAVEAVEKMAGPIPYIDRSTLISGLFSSEDVPYEVEQFFPVRVYVSGAPGDRMTVGFLVHEGGKIEMFEGNDEASEETYTLVNKILGNDKKEVRVWAMHTWDVIETIRDTGKIPIGLYVSPNRETAEGHYDLEGDRALFSGIITKGCVREESEVDWRVMKDCPVKSFRSYS